MTETERAARAEGLRVARWHEARHVAVGAFITKMGDITLVETLKEIAAAGALVADACHGPLVKS